MAYKIKKIPWNTNKKNTMACKKKIEIPWNTNKKHTMAYKIKKKIPWNTNKKTPWHTK